MSPPLFGKNAAPPLTTTTPFSLFNYFNCCEHLFETDVLSQN